MGARSTATRGSRDPERVRAAALEASAKLFAERGFSGTSFQNISAACGVSVGLIQYHFGSKEELYEAVKEHALAAYVASQEPQLGMPPGRFSDFVGAGMRRYFQFFEANAVWTRVSAWAELEGDLRAWPGEHALMDRLIARFREAQRGGELRGDFDPELLLIALGGMMEGWMKFRRRNASRIRHLGHAQAQEDAYVQFCQALLKRGVGGARATTASRSPKAGRAERRPAHGKKRR